MPTNEKQVAINIVSLDVPHPPDYGAMIDVYYRCKALKETGVYVVLHCFEYGRKKSKELNEISDELYFYERKKTILSACSTLPFIVQTRKNPALLKNLLSNKFPILFEGIHSSYFLKHPQLRNRWRGVRAHNIEHDYYKSLAAIEPNFFRKVFFQLEAKKLKNFEQAFHLASAILTVSPKDTDYFQKNYQKGIYVPVFNPLKRTEGAKGNANYALFHGNLSVMENENVVRYICEQIWEADFPLELKIGGKNPSDKLLHFLKELPFPVECFSNPSDEQLNKMIREAKINLLPTFQSTGIKHKLLNCLANGGFCIANREMLVGTGLEKLCEEANSPKEWKEKILRLANMENKPEEFQRRASSLEEIFDMKKNARLIMNLTHK